MTSGNEKIKEILLDLIHNDDMYSQAKKLVDERKKKRDDLIKYLKQTKQDYIECKYGKFEIVERFQNRLDTKLLPDDITKQYTRKVPFYFEKLTITK